MRLFSDVCSRLDTGLDEVTALLASPNKRTLGTSRDMENLPESLHADVVLLCVLCRIPKLHERLRAKPLVSRVGIVLRSSQFVERFGQPPGVWLELFRDPAGSR